MKRKYHFIRGIGSGYALIGANTIYTFASVPMGLHYLGLERFGLWALVLQVAGYLMLLEFGMTGAVSRLLANDKDNVNGGKYGSLLLTGGAVFLVQGILIASLGVFLSLAAPFLFNIPVDFHKEFTATLALLIAASAASISLRSIGAPLWAFQRLDIVNSSGALGLLLSLIALWVSFEAKLGIYSLVVARIPPLILTNAYIYYICKKSGYYPSKHCWGSLEAAIFWKIFHFGKDVLLMNIGSQLLNATQVVIITRFISLDAAATYTIGIKFYTMGQQFVSKILETSAPILTELHVRGESRPFSLRFWQVVNLTTVVATLGFVCLVFGNRAFISIWTSERVVWSLTGDILLGITLILTSVSRCFVGLFGIIGWLKPVRLLYLLEGVFFILFAVFGAIHYGISGVLAASLGVHILTTGFFSLRATLRFVGNNQSAIREILGVGTVMATAGLVSALIWLSVGPVMMLLLTPLAAAVCGIFLWLAVLDVHLRAEVLKLLHSLRAIFTGKMSR